MAHLPTVCDGCARVTLTPFTGSDGHPPDCPHCGGARSVVPSCNYAQADVALFDELSEAVTGGLAQPEAQRLGLEVSRALWSGAGTEILDVVAARWTSLMPLVLVTGGSQSNQRRVLLMLKTIFDAVSLTRRSGIMPAAGTGALLSRGGQR
jgi:hypothetical protein